MSMETSSASESDVERGSDISLPASILWDNQDCLPLGRIISNNDNILLLTPVVVPTSPDPDSSQDPFEILGLALSERLPSVRHVPYTKSQGITGVHVAFIKRAKAVIFVVTEFSDTDGKAQVELADMVNEVCDTQPQVIVACCSLLEDDIRRSEYPTVLRTIGYRQPDLTAVASLLLDGAQDRSDEAGSNPISRPPDASQRWTVQPWDSARDLGETHSLWLGSLPRKFHLDQPTLAGLLDRKGYAMHHIVRAPNGDLVGFCATFTTFADSGEDRLIGSIAALLVRKGYQGRGIGRSLHDEAFSQIHRTRGVNRIQLGSSYPRLLYGLPMETTDLGWFRERGWTVNGPGPGQGRLVTDWVLRFAEMPPLKLSSAGLSFRSCEIADAQEVLNTVSKESAKKSFLGWYDIYAKVVDSSHMGDVILGFEGDTLVATAITYIPSGGSPLAADLPWANNLGADVGGVTCIYIKGTNVCIVFLELWLIRYTDDDPEVINRRDTIMTRTLVASQKVLDGRGMTGMFLDAVGPGERGLEYLGKSSDIRAMRVVF